MHKLDLEKAEKSDQTANIHWIMQKVKEFQEDIYFCFNDYAKAFDYVDQRDGNTRPYPSPKKPEYVVRSNS